jgi:hypothetical protein
MVIFVKGDFFVEGTASGGLRFTGATTLNDEEVPALVEAIRRHRSGSTVTEHFAKRAKIFDNVENPKD